MNLLYPKVHRRDLPLMLALAGAGAMLGGLYGAVHDQITYSISEEYFTRLKFQQFHYADFGLPPRVFVAEIGFLASWWAGMFGAWFLARVAVPRLPPHQAVRQTVRGAAIQFCGAVLGGVGGYLYGAIHTAGGDLSDWRVVAAAYQIQDLDRFVAVACIHNGSYAGGLIGLVAAVMVVHRRAAASAAKHI